MEKIFIELFQSLLILVSLGFGMVGVAVIVHYYEKYKSKKK